MDVSVTMLRSFCVLAQELHYGNAAQRLRIASPSLSQQISRLESQLGARLFERTPRRVAMTEAGRELLPLALAAGQAHQAVVDWAATRRRPVESYLRVGVVAAGAGAWFMTRHAGRLLVLSDTLHTRLFGGPLARLIPSADRRR